MASPHSWCIRTRSSHTHLIPISTTITANEAKLIDKPFARLAPIIVYGFGADGRGGMLVSKRSQGQGEGQTQIFLEFLRVGPTVSGGLDVGIK